MPTLVLAGAEDRLREPGYHHPVVERIPDARSVLVPDAGHLLNNEKADVFNAATIAFLSGREPDGVERAAPLQEVAR